jgi:hypothetical protein
MPASARTTWYADIRLRARILAPCVTAIAAAAVVACGSGTGPAGPDRGADADSHSSEVIPTNGGDWQPPIPPQNGWGTGQTEGNGDSPGQKYAFPQPENGPVLIPRPDATEGLPQPYLLVPEPPITTTTAQPGPVQPPTDPPAEDALVPTTPEYGPLVDPGPAVAPEVVGP